MPRFITSKALLNAWHLKLAELFRKITMKFSHLALLPALLLAAPHARAKNEDEARVLFKSKAPISALAYAPDGVTLASADEKGRLTLTEVATGKIRQDFRYKMAVKALAFAPNGKLLAIGVGREVRLLDPKSDIKTAAPARILKATQAVGDTISFSADGRVLLATEGAFADDFFAVNVWEMSSGQQLRHYNNDKTELHIAALSPDGKSFVAPGIENGLELLSVATGKKTRDFSDSFDHDTPPFEFPFIYGLAFSPDGKWLAGTGCYFESNGHLTLWEVASGKMKWSANFSDCGGIIAWSPDNSRVAAGTSYDTTYNDPQKLHRPTGAPIFTSSGQWQRSLQRVPGAINAIAWAPDGKTLATGAEDGAVRVWKVG